MTVELASVKWDKCICHGYTENTGNEVQFTDISWAKLCESANRRRDHIYDKLRAYIDGTLQLPLAITDIVRHMNCYNVYTLPTSSLLIERKRTLEDASEPEGQPSPEKRLARSQIETIHEETCIICQQRYQKETNDRRKQLKATSFTLQSAINKLRDAAIIRGDKRIIWQLAGGARGGTVAIAGDILKHNLCYCNYTCPSNLEKTAKQSNAEVHQDAFHGIVHMIQLSVVGEQIIWDMNTVHSLHVAALSRHGEHLNRSPSNSKRMLRTKLSTEFGDKLLFYRQVRRNQPELIYSHDITIAKVVQSCKDMEQDEEESTLISTNEPTKSPMHNAYLLGRHLRQKLQLTKNMPWSPEPELCSNECTRFYNSCNHISAFLSQ